MALDKRSIVVFIVMVIGFCSICEGTLYKVGDSAGWTYNGKVDYQAWASSKIFHVGDIILFEYDNRFSNVVGVNHQDYRACSNVHAHFSYNSGNDSFIIPNPGHYYFISGLANHCRDGQRFEIKVGKDSIHSAAPAPAPDATNGATYVSGKGLATVMASATAFYGFYY